MKADVSDRLHFWRNILTQTSTLPRLQFMLGLHFAPGLRFTFSLQSAFYNAVCTLHLVRSQQSAVRSLRFTLTDFSLL